MKRLGNTGVKVGDIIRYDTDGISALGRITSQHAGGWHYEHVLGGYHFVFDHGWGMHGIFEPTLRDIELCRSRKPEWFAPTETELHRARENLLASEGVALSQEPKKENPKMVTLELSIAESLVLIAAITTLNNQQEVGAVLKGIQEQVAVSCVAYDPRSESAVRALVSNKNLVR